MFCGPVKENNSNERALRRRVIRRIRIEPANVAGSGGRRTTISTITVDSANTATEGTENSLTSNYRVKNFILLIFINFRYYTYLHSASSQYRN